MSEKDDHLGSNDDAVSVVGRSIFGSNNNNLKPINADSTNAEPVICESTSESTSESTKCELTKSKPVRSRSTLSITRSIFCNPINSVRTFHKVSCSMRKPTSFHKFGELPYEIRISIWELTILPRIHELHPCSKLYNERMTFRSNSSTPPAILHVNAESRAIALKNYELFDYQPPGLATGKGILRFYFNPNMDTLLLNSLMGLFIMFMLLENADDENQVLGMESLGVMTGWQYVAFDAQRAGLISLLSGVAGNNPQPRFKALFPALKQLVIAFDYNKQGKTKFRTSVWPGENGTRLLDIAAPPPMSITPGDLDDLIFHPMRGFLETDYQEEAGGVPDLAIAKVKRKKFIRGDLRYAFRKTCSFIGLKPRGVFRRL